MDSIGSGRFVSTSRLVLFPCDLARRDGARHCHGPDASTRCSADAPSEHGIGRVGGCRAGQFRPAPLSSTGCQHHGAGLADGYGLRIDSPRWMGRWAPTGLALASRDSAPTSWLPMNLRRTKVEKEPWAPIGAAQHRYAAK